MVTRGIACYTRACKSRLHTHCFVKFTRRTPKCPSCQAEWGGEFADKLRPVGEDAARDGHDTRQRRSQEGDDGDEEADAEEDVDYDAEPEALTQEAPSQAPHKGISRRAKGKKSRVISDEEEEELGMVVDVNSSPPPTQRRSGRRK
jgi:hypothetical protein